MRLPTRTEQSFLARLFFTLTSRKWRAILSAAVLACGLGSLGSSALADPLPENEEYGLIFYWVQDDETGEIAYSLTSSASTVNIRDAMREFILLRIWVTGGDPWKLNPNWVAPTGP